ncbi:hypothetical protein ABK040_012857 [Willaertia magna]
MLSGQMLKAQRFSTTTCLPLHQQSNHHHPQHSFDPMNFELYSLNRLISLSTGHYSNGSDGNTINTSLWEEIPTNSLNALLERRSDSDISETPSSVTTPRSLDTNPNNTFGFTTKRSTTVHNNEDPFSGQSNNILPSPVNTSNIKTTTTNHRTELRPFSLPGGSGSSSYNTPNFMLGNTPSNYTTPSILTTSLSTSTTITNNIITKPITFIQIISGGILNIYQVIISLCSNNVILFYFIGNNLIIKENNNNLLNNSIIKSLTYFNEHDISIINIGMDEFGKYLTCLTNDGDIYIIPICKLFFPNLNNYSSLFSNNLIENYDKKENYFLEQLQQIELIISSNDKIIKKHLKIYNELISLSLHPSILFENIVNATKTNTKRLFQLNIHGKITCCQWWITFSKNLKHKFYLILGTEKGFLIYLNLQTQQEEIIVGGLKFGVKNIKIISDGKTMKYLIISCGRGNYFKQIIEQVDNYQLNTFKNICQFYLDLQNSTNGNQQKKDLVMNNAMNDDNNIFKIHRLDRFCNEFPSFFVNVHKIKEKNTTMISCFDREKHLLSMYDLESISQYTSSSIINNNNATTNNLNNIESRRNSIHSSGVLITDNLYPLFSYQLNDKTALTYPTSNILFSVQRGDNSLLTGRLDKRAFFNQCIDEFRDDSEYQEKLWIISRILSQQQQTLNSSSSLISSLRNKNVLQEFNLPLNEKVMGFLPSYLQKEGTNLESVLFWTQSGIYELKEKNSPLKIFEYLLNNCNKLNIMKETIMIDDFGKTFDLNLFQLYENHADLLYEKGDFDLAFHFYKLSNVDEVKYVQKLINCSSKERKEQVFDYLLNLIENPKNLSITKRKELSMLLFKYCLQKLPKKTMQMNDLLKFKNFLLTNEDYDAQKATELLIHYYYFYCTQFKNNNNTIINIELILQLAHKHRLMKYTLELLVIKGYTSILTDNSIDFLYTNGYCSIVQSVGFGVLLNKFSSNIKIKFMLEYIEYLRILRSNQFSFNSDINNINVNNNENNTLEEKEHFDNHCKIFNFFVETIPLINEIPILLMVCNRFNPEENTLILRETNHTNHHINNQSFYYPYITLEQHIEIFIISMLSLIQLKNNSKEIITSNSNLTTPTMIRNNMSFDNSNLKHIDFTTNILYTHTQEKLEQCLRTFFYRKEFIIDKCLYFNNKSALTIVYEKEEMWIDAICCKINQINENQLNLQNPEIIMKLIFNLFDKYIINKSDELEEETKFKLIEKLFNFYQSLNLPIFKLEEYCLNNLHFIGDSLYQSLLLNNQDSPQFSQQFYSKITDYYTTLHHHLNPTVKL